VPRTGRQSHVARDRWEVQSGQDLLLRGTHYTPTQLLGKVQCTGTPFAAAGTEVSNLKILSKMPSFKDLSPDLGSRHFNVGRNHVNFGPVHANRMRSDQPSDWPGYHIATTFSRTSNRLYYW